MRLATVESVMQDTWSHQLGDRQLRVLDGNDTPEFVGPLIAVAIGNDQTGWNYEMFDRDELPADATGFVAYLDEVVERLMKQSTNTKQEAL